MLGNKCYVQKIVSLNQNYPNTEYMLELLKVLIKNYYWS